MKLLEVFLSMYFGFGLGMCLKLINTKSVMYIGSSSQEEWKELSQLQYILFVFAFCFFWPIRFIKLISSAFQTKDKETGVVLPL
jgi:hypothetical protein